MMISPQLLLKFAIIIFLIGGLIFLSKSNYVKGWFGELLVHLLARLYLDKKTYRLLKNVTLPTEDSTTQIDHIIASKYGIFIVETKNMKGRIFGCKDDKEWTLQIDSHKHKFQNPLRQNDRHAKVLEEILGLMPNRIFSIIVFVGDSKFKTVMPENVTYAGGYIKYIKSKTDPLFGEFEVLDIVKKIEDYRLDPGLKNHNLHIQNLRNHHSRKINQKLRRARKKQTSLYYKLAIISAVILIFGGVAKKTVFNIKEADDEQVTANAETTKPVQSEESQAQKELNKVYRYRDAQGKIRYTNVATAPNAKLVEGKTRFIAKPVSIEIEGDKVLIPVTISHKGTEMATTLILDETIPVSILPMTMANFFEAEILGPATIAIAMGKKISGEKRKVSYFAIGDVVEPDFTFLAIDKSNSANTGRLGKDFLTRHPFSIDNEKKMLIWQ